MNKISVVPLFSKVLYFCILEDFNLTKIRHNKIKKGTTYRHASNCGGKLVEKRVYNAETLLLIHNIK